MQEESRKGIMFGIPLLEELTRIGTGIVTIRIEQSMASRLIANVISRNFRKGKRMLYLHWIDYHSRFWTLNLDKITQMARIHVHNIEEFLRNVFCIRAFSRDQIEVEENWKRVFQFGVGINLAILDSVSELYPEDRNLSLESSLKNQIYSIGNFRELCSRNNCIGLVFDYSPEINPYLGEISSVIIEVELRNNEIILHLIKHPLRETGDFKLRLFQKAQRNLLEW